MRKAVLETPSIQSLDRGLSILEAVADSADPVPLGHLTELLGIDRSSVFRLANTLRRRGFLSNPIGGKDYVLGPSIWRLSRKCGWGNLLTSFSREHVKRLAIETGETAHLAVREGRFAFFIDHYAAPSQVIVVSGQSGETVPLYCTAHGKALLADFTLSELKSVYGTGPFETHTPQTVATVEQLAAECAKIKAADYAFDDAEYNPELRCCAAPIRDEEGEVVAAVGISAPINRFPMERLEICARQVSGIARQISAALVAEPAA